ncbi:MAG TPA: biopolymer transporter ExbD [bacterium]|nr:biopolymer transporter ExbD [bacterium]
MQSRLRSKSKLMAEINMVPFTDLVLVLLVIFMVTTPFLFQGHFRVELPKVAAPTPHLPEVITVTVTEGDKIYLNDKETPVEDLQAALKALVALKPDDLVMINADKNVSHGTVTGILSQAYLAGITKVGIGVETPAAAADAPKQP